MWWGEAGRTCAELFSTACSPQPGEQLLLVLHSTHHRMQTHGRDDWKKQGRPVLKLSQEFRLLNKSEQLLLIFQNARPQALDSYQHFAPSHRCLVHTELHCMQALVVQTRMASGMAQSSWCSLQCAWLQPITATSSLLPPAYAFYAQSSTA